MKSSEILIAAKQVISKSENWTKETSARDSDNNPVLPEEESACKFCSYGAVLKVIAPVYHIPPNVGNFLRLAVREQDRFFFVSAFNDYTETTHGQIMQMFDTAIKFAQTEGD